MNIMRGWRRASGKLEWVKPGDTKPDGRPVAQWAAQVYLGLKPEGGRRYRTNTRCRTRHEAEVWARKLEVDRHAGVTQPTLSKATFADWLRDTWLVMYRTQVRSTYTIEKALGKWILRPQEGVPFLGAKRLDKLTVADFNKLYVALAECGMQYRGIEHLHGLLRRALKYAVGTGELSRNPTDNATLPKPDVRAEITCEADEDDEGEVKALTLDKAKRLVAAAKDDRWCSLWHLLLDAGLRPGEAFALQWRHVDFERGVVRVRGTLRRVRGEEQKDGSPGWKITRPKTKASNGDVPLRADTIKELRRWKAQQAEQRLLMGPEWQDHGFVFTTEFGSPLGNNVGRAWTHLLRKADRRDGLFGTWGPEPTKPRSGPTPEPEFAPRFSMYVLRHTCATLLLLGGMDLLQVSRRLRHKNIGITARFYGHVKAEHTTQASEVWDRMLASAAS